MYDAVTIEKTTVNGIAVDALNETVEAIKTDAEIAKFQFRARNRWIGGTHNRTTINSLFGAHQEMTRAADFTLDKDEPEILLGTDKGANPVEYALAALAGCLTTTLVCFAAVEGIALDEIESEIEGDTDLRGFLGLSDTVRNGLSEIRVSFRIKSDAPAETIRALVELAKSRSGVFDMLSNGVPIAVGLKD